jgi:predicted negative regulator of RcsB-dependent stress response
MPKVIKKRIIKKTSVDTEEGVKEKLSSFRDIIKERQQTAIKYAAAVLIIIVAVAGFSIYSYTSKQKARGLEYEAYKIYYNAPSQGANKGDKYTKALDMFKKAYDSRKSPSSLFYIAACYSELGNYEEAIKTLKDFTGRYSGNEMYAPLAYQKLASAYIMKGDLQEAQKTLATLYNLKGDILKDVALMESAKILEKEGKPDEAKLKYEELAKKFPNSPFNEEIKTKLGVKKEG